MPVPEPVAEVRRVAHGVATVMVREVVLPVLLRLMISMAWLPVGMVRVGLRGPTVVTAVAAEL